MLILRINSAAFCEEEEKEMTPATELVFNLTLLVFFFFSSTEFQLYFGDQREIKSATLLSFFNQQTTLIW